MLSNKDFANMIKSGTDLSGTGGGKARFDLKQVAQWDRQNHASQQKKQGGPKGSKAHKSDITDEIKGSTDEGKSFLLAAGYRDRALERRKDETRVSQGTAESSLQGLEKVNNNGLDEEVIAKLDVEQSKFLGGDVEHTHLVKGLDFALLQKMRAEQGTTNSSKKKSKLQKIATGFDDDDDEEDVDMLSSEDDEDDDLHGVPKDIPTCTALGSSLKQLLFNAQHEYIYKDGNNSVLPAIDHVNQATNKLQTLQQAYQSTAKAGVTSAALNSVNAMAQLFNAQQTQVSKGGDILTRTTFQFDINPLSEQDEPLVILKSKKDAQHGVEYVHYALPADLLQKVSDLFVESGKLISRQKRMKKEEERKKAAEELAKAQALVREQEQHLLKGGLLAKNTTNANAHAHANSNTSSTSGISVVGKKAEYDDDDIYGADLLGDSKEYIPTTAASSSDIPGVVEKKQQKEKKSVAGLNTIVIFSDDEDEASTGTSHSSGGVLKGLFANLRTSATHSQPAMQPASSSSSHSSGANKPSNNTTDVMQPVRDMLAAQTQKERVTKERQLAAKQPVVVETTDSAGKQLVHRDVFATTKEKVVLADSLLGQKAGDAFGMSGSYDSFFGDDDLDSDDGGGGGGKTSQAKKKPRVE